MYQSIHAPDTGIAQGLRAVVLVAFVVLAFLRGSAEAVSISEFDEERAQEVLRSADAKSRTLVYRACRGLGSAGQSLYRRVLESALAYHEWRIEDSIDLARAEANKFSGTLSKLKQQRQFALEYTLADLARDAAHMTELQRSHGDAELWFKETKAQHGRAIASMEVINSSATAIDEIRREIAHCDGKAAGISQRTFNRVMSKHSTFASNLHDRLGELAAFRKAAHRHAKALKYNRAQTWATVEMRTFVDMLNERRHALGLSSLYLEKRLSVACASHSREMVELEYIAHRSPVIENSTPDKRAAKAKYPGTFVGENLFFYVSPQNARAAFDAWWESDGHRFVMFDPKSEQIGLSNSPATHWAMMTGVAPVSAAIETACAE
ncbi:MAG: hypothetical protein ACI8XO_004032 [Verrucomicrobiales bacterium]|jgi:uncharacterized protein YkwD